MAPAPLDPTLNSKMSGPPEHHAAMRTLVDQMTEANPLWGAPRIHGKFGTLGIAVSERTVSRLLGRRRRPPSQTWRTFLTNHVASLVSMTSSPRDPHRPRAVRARLLTHHRRRIVHLAVTEHPTAAWTAQQIIEAFPNDTAPQWLLRDRDAIYGDACRRRVAGMGITEVITSPSSPWQNPYAERLIGSIRRECLDHVIVLGERHLRRLLTANLTYYHGAPHIWPWRRTRRRHDASRRLQKDPSSRSLKLADCIIATNDVQPDGHG